MKLTIYSEKFGFKEFQIDEDDFKKLNGWSFYLWSTPRHSGIYVNCYSPENRRSPKRLHRVIMAANKGEIVDHINGNPLDNRKENLRIVTSLVNNQNARKRKDGVTSKFKGVSWCKAAHKWKAQIQIKGHKLSLGNYVKEIHAAIAYNSALSIFNVYSPKNIIPNNLADLK